MKRKILFALISVLMFWAIRISLAQTVRQAQIGEAIIQVGFSPDSKSLVVATVRGKAFYLRDYSIPALTIISSFEEPNPPSIISKIAKWAKVKFDPPYYYFTYPYYAAFSPALKKLVWIEDWDRNHREIKLWDITTQNRFVIPVGQRWHSLAFSPDENLIAGGIESGDISLLEIGPKYYKNRITKEFACKKVGLLKSTTMGQMVFSPDGKFLCAFGSISSKYQDATIRFWDVAKREEISIQLPTSRQGSRGSIYSVALAPDLKWIVLLPQQVLFKPSSQKSLSLPQRELLTGPSSFAFSPDSKWLAAGDKNGLILLWDMEELTRLAEQEEKTSIAQAEKKDSSVPLPEVRDAEFYFKEGLAYDRQGQYDQAIAAYNRALEMNPTWPSGIYNCRGNAYSAKGEYDRAIEDYTKAIELNPKEAVAFYNRGNIYFKKGEYLQAIADYNKAIEIHPNYAQAQENIALIYYQQGEVEKAIAEYRAAIKSYSYLQDYYKDRKQDYTYINHKLAQASNNIAWFSAQIGQNLDEALQFAKKAVELEPIASHLDTLGYVHYKRGEYQEAEKEILRALELEPKNEEYQKHLEEIQTAKTLGTSTIKTK
jgi:tetratricopeptide (TPR) repeat protein